MEGEFYIEAKGLEIYARKLFLFKEINLIQPIIYIDKRQE